MMKCLNWTMDLARPNRSVSASLCALSEFSLDEARTLEICSPTVIACLDLSTRGAGHGNN